MSDAPPAWLQLADAQQAAAEGRYGTVVRLARIAAGLTLEDAGRLVGYSSATLSRIERGLQPLTDVRLLRRFAMTFSIPPEVFGLADAQPLSSPPQATPVKLRGSAVSQGGPVRRREFLSVATGVSLAPVVGTDGVSEDPGQRLVAGLDRLSMGPLSRLVR